MGQIYALLACNDDTLTLQFYDKCSLQLNVLCRTISQNVYNLPYMLLLGHCSCFLNYCLNVGTLVFNGLIIDTIVTSLVPLTIDLDKFAQITVVFWLLNLRMFLPVWLIHHLILFLTLRYIAFDISLACQ